MTQIEYDIIVKCIKQGVPALADNLILSLNSLVVSVNNADKNEKKNDTKKTTKEKKGEN